MSVFSLYLQLGIEHIADVNGYDHILFILVLCIGYTWHQWRQILILVTAFTIGHSLTLALATLQVLSVSTEWIEFLIPVTIVLTALGNILQNRFGKSSATHAVRYGMALFFGLIHGLGFSNYLQQLLGMEESIVMPLLAFNVGIELGQLIIVAIITFLTLLAVDILKSPRREWNLVFSGAALGISFIMALERLPF